MKCWRSNRTHRLVLVVVASAVITACGGGSESSSPTAAGEANASGNTGTTAGSSPGSSGSTTSAGNTLTVAQAIVAAESNGTLPRLNRDSSVAGIDANRNGIRDDIDAYIASVPDTAVQKAALSQYAFALQSTLLIDTTNSGLVMDAAMRLSRGAKCLFSTYDATVAPKKGKDLEKLIVNTRTRFNASTKFAKSLSGNVVFGASGSGCV